MEKSQLEEISDRVLYHLCHLIETKLNGDVASFDDKFFSICDSVSKLFGYRLDYIDYDYILNLLDINDFSEKTPKQIKKPEASLYGFDYDEFETQWVRRTYYNTITSYSGDKNQIFDLISVMNSEGNLDYYDGNQTNTDIYDSEVTDVKLDRTSLNKIKTK